MFVLDTNGKGLIAELEIELTAVRCGVPVLRPQEHSRCDLAFDVGGRIWRVQCKWGRLNAQRDVIVVSTAGARLSPRGWVHTPYDESVVDLFGVYCGDLDCSYLIPVSRVAGQYQLHLRLTPPRNGQRACITLVEDFAFQGAVAQLGERRHGMAEARGSSPLSSTESLEPVTVGVNAFRDGLGVWMDRVAAGEVVILTRHGRPKIRLSPAA
jgi:prevent-host-death family protein